ncbi:MAG TPA: flagellar basal body protein [Bryobacteraceae bacterium]|jgi:flagellar hook-associated protein 1 FlgK|nr:flagellar basal body protein [Bryobacteraceae bacterium]
MAGLLSGLQTAGHALDVMEQAMSVIQNNVANASTPGYAAQKLNISSVPFQDGGGIQAGTVSSSRNQYAEQSVQHQNSLLGTASQQAASLSSLQNIFNVTGKTGIPAALSNLYSAFSAWSASPADATTQQQVLTAAKGVAQAFNSAASNIGQIQSQTDRQVTTTLNQINNLTSQIAGINQQIRYSGPNDAGLQANLYNDLEQLSNLTSVDVQIESDGTATVLMAGQTPLVSGATQTQLQSSTSANGIAIMANDQDVTSTLTDGQLAALVNFRNQTLPSVVGNATQPGTLNQLAQAVASQINSLLTSGQTASGVSGLPLFVSSANYTINGQTVYVPPPTGQIETLTFTTPSGASVTATVNAGDKPPTVIAEINEQTSALGIHAVLNQAGTGITFQSDSAFSMSDTSTAPGIFSSSTGTYTAATGASNAVAATLSVNPLAGSDLAPAQVSGSANGIASQLAQLGTATNPTLGMSYTDFYSDIASTIGSQESAATTAQQTQTDLLTQAQNMRAQVSGVSLNDQAAQLLQFQQAYQASSQLIQVISSTMQYFMQAMQQI